MLESERNEIISTILYMERALESSIQIPPVSISKLNLLTDLELIKTFNLYKNRLRHYKKNMETGAYLSAQTYKQMERILQEEISINNELLQMNWQSFDTKLAKKSLLFDEEMLDILDFEEKIQILAYCFYYQFIRNNKVKERMDNQEICQTCAIVDKIHYWFPFTNDFYAILYRTPAINWEKKSEEERLQELKIMLSPYFEKKKNHDDLPRKKTYIEDQ